MVYGLLHVFRLGPFRRRGIPEPEVLLELPDILLPALLPIHCNQAFRTASALDRPGHVLSEEARTLGRANSEMPERRGEAGHGEPEVGELEEFDRELGSDVHGQVDEAVVEVVRLAVALHHVCELRVVHIVRLRFQY